MIAKCNSLKIYMMNKQIGNIFINFFLLRFTFILNQINRYSIADDVWQSKENRDKAVKNLLTE